MEQFIKNLARGAGAILREGFKKDIQINHKKGHWDVVTQYDLAADKYIVERIRKKFPSHGILSEEGTDIKRKKNLWIIDPLDGTRNFSRGVPFFCTTFSYVKNGTLEAGATYDPIHDELFFAMRGRGAFLNGKPIKTITTSILDHALASLWGPRERTRNVTRLQAVHDVWNVNPGSGALSIAYIAAGRTDFYAGAGASPWDYSGSAIIAHEAGAKISNWKGKPYRWDMTELVAANPDLHKKVIKELNK